jgi:hypothetical protein
MTTRSRVSSLSALALAAPLCFAPLAAQDASSGGVLAGFERYTFADPAVVGIRDVTLVTLPFAVQPYGNRTVQLLISGAFASGHIERADGSRASLTGPTDTEIRLSFSAPRYFGVSTALLLPTGRSTHTAEQADVAGIMAADLLPFRVSNWGSGGGADASATAVFPAGPLNLGLRIGYQLTREFEPLDDQPFMYRPGNQLYGRVAVDYNVGRRGKASAHVTVQQFSADELDGSNLYQSGDRVQVMGSYAFVAGARSTGLVYAGAQHRGAPAVFGANAQLPTQDLLLAGGGFRVPVRFGVLTPGVDVRVFRSADGLGQGYAAGFGTAADVRVGGGGFTLAPSLRLRIGRVVMSEGAESRLIGLDSGFAVRFGQPRSR